MTLTSMRSAWIDISIAEDISYNFTKKLLSYWGAQHVQFIHPATLRPIEPFFSEEFLKAKAQAICDEILASKIFGPLASDKVAIEGYLKKKLFRFLFYKPKELPFSVRIIIKDDFWYKGDSTLGYIDWSRYMMVMGELFEPFGVTDIITYDEWYDEEKENNIALLEP